jgi:hypothetical protein
VRGESHDLRCSGGVLKALTQVLAAIVNEQVDRVGGLHQLEHVVHWNSGQSHPNEPSNGSQPPILLVPENPEALREGGTLRQILIYCKEENLVGGLLMSIRINSLEVSEFVYAQMASMSV